MDPKKLTALVVAIAMILAGGAWFLFANSSSQTPVEAESTLPSPVATTPTPTPATTAPGNRPGGSASTPRPSDLPTVASFEELDVEKAQVSRELAESAVCGLNSTYFYEVVPRSGSTSDRIDAVRMGLPTIDENVGEWYLASDLDGRIYDGVLLAQKAQYQWGRAVALADRGNTAASAAALAKGDRLLVKMDRLDAQQLCPR